MWLLAVTIVTIRNGQRNGRENGDETRRDSDGGGKNLERERVSHFDTFRERSLGLSNYAFCRQWHIETVQWGVKDG